MDTSHVCDFESSYACGYHNQADLPIKWQRVKALDVDDGVVPETDSSGSVLGKYNSVASHQSKNVQFSYGTALSMDNHKFVLSKFVFHIYKIAKS